MRLLLVILVITFCSCRTALIRLTPLGMFTDTEGMSLKSKHNTNNNVFQTNAKFVYSAYRVKNNDTIDSQVKNYLDSTFKIDQVELTVLPGKFFDQTKIKWEYITDEDSVIKNSITGIMEDSNQIWIHPPRAGIPFAYTEAAAFPRIKFPLKENKTWEGGLDIVKGYEEYGIQGKTKYIYKVIGKKSIVTEFKKFENCWLVSTTGESSLGISKHNFYFHEKYGFIYMEYKFPNGEELILNLKEYSL